jgi:hypothetical protein
VEAAFSSPNRASCSPRIASEEMGRRFDWGRPEVGRFEAAPMSRTGGLPHDERLWAIATAVMIHAMNATTEAAAICAKSEARKIA